MKSHMELDAPIFVAGHNGLVGSAIRRELLHLGFTNVLVRDRSDLDLQDKASVAAYFRQTRPRFVILAAAKVGGILANSSYPADFIRDNLEIQTNVIDAAYTNEVDRLLFLGSSCIYPRLAPQPITESSLLSGPLEPTNRAYAIAKIAGIEMCWSYNLQYGTRYIGVMPANIYGPGDNFDLKTSHVLPALIKKTSDAILLGSDKITLWGTGEPRREFLYSDDLAAACVFLLNLPDSLYSTLLSTELPPIINIGTGCDVSIRELAVTVTRVMGFEGEVIFDPSMPDGTPRKVLDVSRIHRLGWHAVTSLEVGVHRTWQLVREKLESLRPN